MLRLSRTKLRWLCSLPKSWCWEPWALALVMKLFCPSGASAFEGSCKVVSVLHPVATRTEPQAPPQQGLW